MTVILSSDIDTCIHIPFLQRYEDVKDMSVVSFQWYDTKGKWKDYRETIFCFDGKRAYFYEDNDLIESKLADILTGVVSTSTIDLSNFNCATTRRKVPKGFKNAIKVA